CLLTQYPLLFLTGRRSIFYFQGYWNWIPRFLSDHGYEVMTLDLPWRKKGARRQVLEEFLRVADEKGLKFHFIGDATCESDLEWLGSLGHTCVQSCYVIRRDLNRTAPLRAADLRPPAKITRQFLLEVQTPK